MRKSKSVADDLIGAAKIPMKRSMTREEKQQKAFEFLTNLMVLESSIMVKNDGDVWYYLMNLLKQDCAESNNLDTYKEIETYIHDELAGKHSS